MKEVSEGIAAANGGGVDYKYTRGLSEHHQRLGADAAERAVAGARLGKDRVSCSIRVWPGKTSASSPTRCQGLLLVRCDQAGTTAGGHHKPPFRRMTRHPRRHQGDDDARARLPPRIAKAPP